MIARFALGLAAVFAFAFLALPQPAAAAFPCPNGPGPGEVQVGVSGGSHGVAAVPMCESTGGGNGGGGEVYYIYGAIVWHPDADDVWMVGSYDAPYIAEREVMAACNNAMGGGCSSIGEWHNSSMTIMRDSQGGLWNGWNGQGGASRKRVLAECSSKQLLPCEILHSFGADKRRYNPQPTARKFYASAAWVYGKGYDGRLYIASGHRGLVAAEQAALAACAAGSVSTQCRVAASVGNGLIQPFKANSDTNVVAERTAKRGAQAAQADCKRRQSKCQLQRSYDSRIPGQFVHDFHAAAAK